MTCITTDCHIIILVLIIVFVGAFAGLTNFSAYYFQQKKDKRDKKIILKYLFSGIGAAILVPLLLNMLSSNLIKESQEFDSINYFVFAGFCFVAGYFSDRFINSMGAKILRDLEEAKNIANEAIDSAKTVEENFKVIFAADAEADVVEGNIDIVEELPNYLMDTENSMYKVLKSFDNTHYKFRTSFGISRSTELDRPHVIRTLDVMEGKGITRKLKLEKGRILWSLTSKGREFLERMV